MKCKLLLFFFFFAHGAMAQPSTANYAFFKNAGKNNNLLPPDTLAKQITKNLSTDKEKVTAIFSWITDNISYGIQKQNGFKKNIKHVVTDEYLDSLIDSKELNERVAYAVLQSRTAVCNGYARLFKTLCDYAGIQSEIVTGFARSNYGNASSRFRSNHTWNAVKIDSIWHLLDVTWASGYILFGSNEFVRQYDGFYFLTPPELFIRNHFPEDPRWTLLQEPPTFREFNNTPFKPSAFIKYAITSFKPATGVIDAHLGDTLMFEIKSSDIARDMKVAADRDYDSLYITGLNNNAFLKPAATINDTTLYQYMISEPSVAWLNIVYNDDLILRYRLNIKKQD